MKNGRFGSAYSELKYGLVRIDGRGVIIDKNEMAEAILPLPRRGSSMLGIMLGDGKLDGLADAVGSSLAVVLENEGIRRNAVAFRESSGTVLLLLHPLLSTLHLGHNGAHFKKILSFYSKNILSALESAENNRNSYFRMASLPDKTFFGGMSVNNYYVLKNAVDKTAKKLENTELSKELKVVVENPPRDARLGVVLTHIEFVLSELLSVRELYGEEKEAVLYIGYADSCLVFALKDKITPSGKLDECFFKVFSEIMKLIDVGSYVEISDSGELLLKAYIPYIKINSLANTPPHAEWSYFDYSRAYYFGAK